VTTPKHPRCTGCGRPTANRKRVCSACLGAGPARLSWRAAHTLGHHLPEPGPRVVRLAIEERCGGGTRRVADRADY
jgi:ribosomal protein L37E